jgi:protein SCO1/2
MRTAKRSFSWQWLLSIPVLIALGVAAFAILRPIQVLPRIALAPGYALTDHNGNLFTSEDMRGKITLYTFTYTRCTGPCIQTTPLLQEVQARLGEIEMGDVDVPIEMVTISIDPEHDTPEMLAAYAQQIGADRARWHFATTETTRLKWIIGAGFGLFFDQRDDGSFILDQGYMLVDGAGILRAEYRLVNPGADIILRDLQLLVNEAGNSEGAARYAYEAAHLFLCYPR